MKKEVRTVAYDGGLHMEAYRFEGLVQPFPNHFHEYYVSAFVQGVARLGQAFLRPLYIFVF